MADILASIRRILTEDDPPASDPPAAAPPASEAHEEVLVLDRSMMIEAPAAERREPAARHADDDRTVRLNPPEVAMLAAAGENSPPQAGSEHVSSNPVSTTPVDPAPEPQALDSIRARRQPGPSLAEPGTVTAVASSLSNLARSVAAERSAAIQRHGLSIEDVVREEVRPLLKAWLDMHLPGLVERLVQAEIERVVNRATF